MGNVFTYVKHKYQRHYTASGLLEILPYISNPLVCISRVGYPNVHGPGITTYLNGTGKLWGTSFDALGSRATHLGLPVE